MILLLVLCLVTLTSGKIYDRCELARELKYVQNAPSHQIATWVCIAEHESLFNTSAVGHLGNDGSGDHGIFQINDKFWCSPPGNGYACGLTCAELEDDDITDDFICAQRIYKEHKTLSGDGFNAWAVYKPLCKGSKAERYIKDCFNDIENFVPDIATNSLSDFAHGFFGSVGGKANKEFTISTETPATFDAFFTPSTTSFYNPSVDNSGFNNPTSRILPTTSSTTPSRFFFTPTTKPTTRFAPFSRNSALDTSRTFFPPSTRGSIFTSTTPSPVFQNNKEPVFNGKTISGTSRTFFTPSTTRASFFTSTTPGPVFKSAVSKDRPVFIINGVKWI